MGRIFYAFVFLLPLVGLSTGAVSRKRLCV